LVCSQLLQFTEQCVERTKKRCQLHAFPHGLVTHTARLHAIPMSLHTPCLSPFSFLMRWLSVAAGYYFSITLRTLGIYTLGLVQAYWINQQRLAFHNFGFPWTVCIIKIHLTLIQIMGYEIHVRGERGENDAL